MTKTFTWLILLMLTFVISRPVKVGEMAWNEDARIDEVMPSLCPAAKDQGAGSQLCHPGGVLVPPLAMRMKW